MHSSYELGGVYVIEDASLSSTFLPSPFGTWDAYCV